MPAMIDGFGGIKQFFIIEKYLSSKSNKVLYITYCVERNKKNPIASHENIGQNSNSFFKQKKLGPYLAGLGETDGSISVHNKNSKVKNYSPRIIIVFNLVDKLFANRLGFITQSSKVYLKGKCWLCVRTNFEKTRYYKNN